MDGGSILSKRLLIREYSYEEYSLKCKFLLAGRNFPRGKVGYVAIRRWKRGNAL